MNEAFTGLWIAKIKTKAEEIKKANFKRMSNGDLLVRYIETMGLEDKLKVL